MSRPLRLLVVTPEYPPEYGGGIGTYYAALLPALVRAGYHVDVIVGSAFVRGGGEAERDGVHVRTLDPDRADRGLAGYARYAPAPEVQRHLAAARAIWEQADGGAGYDAVEVVDWGLLFAPWVAEPGPPTLIQFHASSGEIADAEPDPRRALEGDLLRLTEAALLRSADALSSYGRPTAKAWTGRLGRDVAYVPPPLPPRDRLRPDPRSEAGFAAGRLQLWKGPDVLAEALRHLGADAPAVEWAGRAVAHPDTGEPFDAYLARTHPDVWGRTLRPLGLLRPDEVARRMAAAAFVAVPSRWDVFNYTAAEAMQQGAVVVCSDGAGAADLIEDGVNGYVAPAGNAAALAEAVRRASRLGAEARAAMGDAAAATVAEALDPDRIATLKTDVFTRLLAADCPEADPWAAEAVAPKADGVPLGFLDHLALRPLAAYVGRRGWETVRRRFRR